MMKYFNQSLIVALGVVALAGCVTHEREVVHEKPTGDVIVVDPHRTWWESYHRSEAYDRERALAAHRAWCGDHPADVSCSGWDTRN
jgi:hypothetical protein